MKGTAKVRKNAGLERARGVDRELLASVESCTFMRYLPQQKAERVTMHAQIITYQLDGISQPDYLKQMVEPDALALADVSGLMSKVWLADAEQNAFGGFYLWESKEAMDTFMQSDLVAAVVSRPFVKNVSSVDYTVNEAASKITRGLK